jgi:hypothetical protein
VIKFYKVAQLPQAGQLQPNSVYFERVASGVKLNVYVTDYLGYVAYSTYNVTDITSIASNVVNAALSTYVPPIPSNVATLDASSNVIQNANTSSKWKTAIILSLTGVISGSATFDGSGNVTVQTSASNLKIQEYNPSFTYDSNKRIVRIDYLSGNYKLFNYNGNNINYIDYVIGTVTKRSVFNYNQNNTLSSIVTTNR